MMIWLFFNLTERVKCACAAKASFCMAVMPLSAMFGRTWHMENAGRLKIRSLEH